MMGTPESGTAVPAPVRDSAGLPKVTEKLLPVESLLAGGRLHIVVLLCIPALVLLRQTNAIFPDPRFVDSWIYLGFFKNLFDFKRYLFTETYYATRMSWILPGWLINQVFLPQAANYLIHLSVFYLFIFSLYSAVSRLVHRRAALITALACGFYPYLWGAVGSDYVDGVGIACYMTCFALLTRAAFSDQRRISLVVAGAFAAAMIHTNLSWCLPVLLLAVHYCGMAVLRGREWRHVIVDLLIWFALGSLALSGFLAAVNFWMVGDPWFYMPSVRFVQRNGTVSLRPHYGMFGWPLRQWLKYPVVMLVAGCLVMAVRVRRNGIGKNIQTVLVLAHLGLLFAIFVVMEGRGTTVLTVEFYASYLIPLTFLSLGAILPCSIEAPKVFAGWTIALVGAFGCTWWMYNSPAPENWTVTGTLPAVAVIVIAGLLRYQPAAAGASVLGLGLLTYSVRLAPEVDPNYRRAVFERLMQASSRVEYWRQGRPPRFWYDLDESSGREFRSLCSLYVYNYSLISEKFPALPDDREVEPGVLLIMPTNHPDVPGRALEALKRKGLGGTVEDAGPIGVGKSAFHLFMLIPQFDAETTEPMGVVLDPGGGAGRLIPGTDRAAATTFPPGGWTLYDAPGAWMQKLADGILVRTRRTSYSNAAKYALLTSEVEGDYHFMLRYSADFGNAGFGALKGDESGWLDAHGGTLLGKVSTVGFTVHLKQGEQFRLAAINSHADDLASQFVLKELTATRLKTKGDAQSIRGKL